MTREEMIAILTKSSGETRTKEEIESLLDTSIEDAKRVGFEGIPIEEDTLCVCGEPLNDGGEHYDHMSNGY